jgi:hypothetical protein
MKKAVIAAMALILAALWASQAAAQQYQFIGSFVVSDGPTWTTNPPVYSGQEAAALLFGGSPGDYRISTNSNTTDPTTITDTAWYSTWGTGCAEHPHDFRVDDAPPGYNDPGGTGTAVSAYVSDHGCDVTNYVWRVATPVPTLSQWAIVALCTLLAVAGMRHFRRDRTA